MLRPRASWSALCRAPKQGLQARCFALQPDAVLGITVSSRTTSRSAHAHAAITPLATPSAREVASVACAWRGLGRVERSAQSVREWRPRCERHGPAGERALPPARPLRPPAAHPPQVSNVSHVRARSRAVFRSVPHAPRVCSTRGSAAACLTPSLLGHAIGLLELGELEGGEGLDELWKAWRVSGQDTHTRKGRVRKLCALIEESRVETQGPSSRHNPFCTHAVLLALLWVLARRPACLLECLDSAHRLAPILNPSGGEQAPGLLSLHPPAAASSPIVPARPAGEVEGGLVSPASPAVLVPALAALAFWPVSELQPLASEGSFDRAVCRAISEKAGEVTVVAQTTASFRGQPARPNCAEAVLQTLCHLLFGPLGGLPDGLRPAQGLVQFFAGPQGADAWMDVVSGLPGVEYRCGDYELVARLDNLLEVMCALLGCRVRSFRELGDLLCEGNPTRQLRMRVVNSCAGEEEREADPGRYGSLELELLDRSAELSLDEELRLVSLVVHVQRGHAFVEAPSLGHTRALPPTADAFTCWLSRSDVRNPQGALDAAIAALSEPVSPEHAHQFLHAARALASIFPVGDDHFVDTLATAAVANLSLQHRDCLPFLLASKTPFHILSYGARAISPARLQACVAELLTHPQIDPNLVDKQDRTALCVAALNGHRSCVNSLLAHPQIDPRHADEYGRQPRQQR